MSTIPPPDAHGYWHFVYKTSDPETGDWYIGKHSTRHLDDGYKGSGAWIRRHPQKDRLQTKILAFFHSNEAALLVEEQLIDLTVISCRNYLPGGPTIVWPNQWADPDYRTRVTTAIVMGRKKGKKPTQSSILRAKKAKRLKDLWNDPNYRLRQIAAIKKANQGQTLTTDQLNRMVNSLREKAKNDPEFRALLVANGKRTMAQPEVRARMNAASHAARVGRKMSSEECRKSGIARKQWWASLTPEQRREITAPGRAASIKSRRARANHGISSSGNSQSAATSVLPSGPG